VKAPATVLGTPASQTIGGGNEVCTHLLDNNRWNDLACHAQLRGIVEIDNTNVYNCHRYILTNKPMSFNDAERQAINMGGHLAALNSAAEHDYLWKRFGSRLRQHLWIGLTRTQAHGPFKGWKTGEPLEYTGWHPGEPNDWGAGEECTHMLAWARGWNDIACGNAFFGVIEIPLVGSCGLRGGGAQAPADPSNPVVSWRLNGNVRDLSGNNIGAYLAGSVAWQTAPAGARKFLAATPSLYFNSGAYPQAYNPNSFVPYLTGDASFTFMVWAYYDSRNWPSEWVGVWGATPGPDKGAYNNGVGLAVYQGNLCLQFYGSEARATNPIGTMAWHHLAATKVSGGIGQGSKLFINGELVEHVVAGSDSAPSIIPAVPMLGRSGNFKLKTKSDRYWNGYLKDARIYATALPAAQIRKIYNEEW